MYREENDQVILTMDWIDCGLLMCGLMKAAGMMLENPPSEAALKMLLNRLNEGNPHYTPYQVEAKKS